MCHCIYHVDDDVRDLFFRGGVIKPETRIMVVMAAATESVHHQFITHMQPQNFGEAVQAARVIMSQGYFMNIAWGLAAAALFIGTILGQWLIGWALFKILMMCNCCGAKRDKELHDKRDSEEHPHHVPVQGRAAFSVMVDDGGDNPSPTSTSHRGPPRLIPKHPASIHVHQPGHQQQQQYVHYPDKKDNDKYWHGHVHNAYESYVRLCVILVRLTIVVIGLVISFSVAGVNFFSLAVSIGVLSLVFTYGAGGLVSNVFAAIYMFSSGKVKLGMWLQIGSYEGEVTAMRVQQTELVNDYDAWKGRRIHHIPNKLIMETPMTIYDDGPSPGVIKHYRKTLKEVEAWENSKQD